ncbi:N-acetyltransferase [Sphingobacterium faecium]|uniref:N-acetyltransferase n=1 Tax=Sphingobacterium faecium TaxID=34087 RepID=UPI00320788D3
MNNAMIRKAGDADLDQLVEIWYEASQQAHNFIKKEYWETNKTAMRTQYLPSSEIYLLDHEAEISGFIALVENEVAAIFVSPTHQGKGIGTLLLNHVKKMRDDLQLKVYKNNRSSVAFYQKKGFAKVSELIDAETGETELMMKWHKE